MTSRTRPKKQPPADRQPRWTREQIRAARLVMLAPLLEKRGLHLHETGGGNFHVREFPGLIIKESYWRWPEQDISGNTIDFYLQVLQLDFHDAMLELTLAPRQDGDR